MTAIIIFIGLFVLAAVTIVSDDGEWDRKK
jgi:hypothetical protein